MKLFISLFLMVCAGLAQAQTVKPPADAAGQEGKTGQATNAALSAAQDNDEENE